MNRREFLAGTATVAATAGTELGHNGAAAATAPDQRLCVLVPELRVEQIAELKAVAPGVELVVCKDATAALARAPEAHAVFGFITPEVIRAGVNLRWAQQMSAGVEGVLTIPELVERPITLTNMQRAYGPEIADQAIGYLLCFTRSLGHFIQAKSREEWHTPREAVLDELEGKTLLVIGLGGIGSQVARRATGFGMQVIATDPKVIERPVFVAELHRPDALLELLPRAEVVTIAAPLTAKTEKLLGAREFGLMRNGAILINVARGKIIDTPALVAALESRQVAAAGLDVTDPEPLPPGHSLWKQNVIITPHSAGQSPGGFRRSYALFRENLRRFVAGEMLLNIVDKKAGY
jgi:phosphoglycerate dehydrogenase-like enzyme